MLTESAVLPPYRVCTDGFDYACRAGTFAIGRPDGTVGAISAHSAPTVPSGRPNRSSPRPFSSHRGVAPSTLIATSPVPGPRPATRTRRATGRAGPGRVGEPGRVQSPSPTRPRRPWMPCRAPEIHARQAHRALRRWSPVRVGTAAWSARSEARFREHDVHCRTVACRYDRSCRYERSWGCAPVWGDGNRVLVALAAPSVCWWRRACRQGGRSRRLPPSIHSQSRHSTLDATA